jgi:Holliday junction resolvase-like predicted endonuclease
MARAAQFWLGRQPRYREHDLGFDAILVVPSRLPIYLPDSLHGMAPGQR